MTLVMKFIGAETSTPITMPVDDVSAAESYIRSKCGTTPYYKWMLLHNDGSKIRIWERALRSDTLPVVVAYKPGFDTDWPKSANPRDLTRK